MRTLEVLFVLAIVMVGLLMVVGPDAPPVQTVPALDLGLD